MEDSQAQQLEKKIAALESEVFALRSEFERARRGNARAITNAALPAQPQPETTRPVTVPPAGCAGTSGYRSDSEQQQFC